MNRYTENFLKENGLDIEFYNSHIGVFHHVEESLNRCENCNGLFTCTQKSQGQRLILEYDEGLIERIENCPFKKNLETTKNIKDMYVYSNIPDRYYDLTLENITLPDDEVKKLCALCLEIYQGRSDRGLYVYGSMGTGKTYMFMALANSLVKSGKKVAFVKTIDFVNELRKTVTLLDGEFEDTMNLMKKCEYLFLDDIGSESVSTFARDDVLFNILDYRMENGLTTCFTSNYDMKGLMEHYTYLKSGKAETLQAQRLIERIDILTDKFVLNGNNKRRMK